MKCILALGFFLGSSLQLLAQAPNALTGTVVDRSTERPVPAVTVTLKQRSDGSVVRSATSDPTGKFELTGLAAGNYDMTYGIAGAANSDSLPVSIRADSGSVDLGRLTLTSAEPVRMEAFEVGARQEAVYNSLDRKVYDVGKDITSTTGSTSDLLQNIPSVEVDVEGNVSLRGDNGVQILINGKPSAMMEGSNRAAVLEQMSVDNIERIEVITNPSAKYKPDGTGGIINIVLKRERSLGSYVSTRLNVGNDDRYNAGVTAHYNHGKYTLRGSASVRQDDRGRSGREIRSRFDNNSALLSSTAQDSTENSRPFSRVAQFGAEYQLSADTKLGASLSFDDRELRGHSRENNVTRDATGAVTRDYERLRTGPESEKETEFELTFEHKFPSGDRKLSGELSHGSSREKKDELASNLSRLAGVAPTFDARSERNEETQTDLSVDYVHPFSAGAKLELGYEFEREKTDIDFRASVLDPVSNQWIVDPQTTNRFVHDSQINAVYATFGRPFGKFGVLGGLRYEQASIKTDQRAVGLKNTNDYIDVYPSVHLSYRITDAHQLQLSYSHRVNRPDGDDLNPFPQYDDPFDRHAGNPNLKPENTHSIEGGYQYENDGVSYLASLYVRQQNQGITDVTRYIDANTLLTTPENLATSRSAGLELGATRRIGDRLALNFSANAYRSEINAANLGFSARRSAFAWDAKLNTSWDATDQLVLQLTTSYRARRLTAQGERQPSASANLGLRYNLKDKRTALVFTASDLFNSMKDRTLIDTPTLKGETTRRRSSQIFYVGIIYSFGKSGKKSPEQMQFEDAL